MTINRQLPLIVPSFNPNTRLFEVRVTTTNKSQEEALIKIHLGTPQIHRETTNVFSFEDLDTNKLNQVESLLLQTLEEAPAKKLRDDFIAVKDSAFKFAQEVCFEVAPNDSKYQVTVIPFIPDGEDETTHFIVLTNLESETPPKGYAGMVTRAPSTLSRWKECFVFTLDSADQVKDLRGRLNRNGFDISVPMTDRMIEAASQELQKMERK